MSLAKGINKNQRKPIIQQHRLLKFMEAFDKYIRGEVSASFVTERGEKLKVIGGNKIVRH